MSPILKSNLQKYGISFLLIIYFSMFFSQKILLVVQDLGRHITNGKILIETGNLISTNYYSYTEPYVSAINHHWLTGVLFYFIHKFFNFTGLSIFYLLISGITVFLFFKTAQRKSNFIVALFITFLMLPLISQRKEIRPEGFSYLFISLYYYLLTLFVDKKIKFKILLPIIALCQLIWVNSHIFFIFGIFITSVFTFIEFIKVHLKTTNTQFKNLAILTVTTVLISIINPYGIFGLIEPFNIFKQYGYQIVENQSLFFMQKFSPDFKYVYVEILALVYLYLGFNLVLEKKILKDSALFLITGIFMIMAFKMIRIIPIFALFCVPLLAQTIYQKFKDFCDTLSPYILLILVISFIPIHYFSALPQGRGIGLVPQINISAEFFKNNNIKGPVFNNYDIGGYLIYHFNNQEKVFVDNRPEAYSVNFFTKTYIPMQENQDLWEEMDKKYHFNSIYFYRMDLTPWAQNFLIKMIQNTKWTPIFVDDYTIIFVKNNELNKEVISKHALPKSMFITT